MAKMSSLGIAISGLHAAQTGLSVTGHNLANTDTVGFVRQQALQSDFFYTQVGSSGLMKLGLGTNVSEIRQIRDKFLDISYRDEISRVHFYDVKYAAGVELERMLGETEGSYKFQSVLTDMWDALNELAIDPKSVETRGNFISTSVTFIDKANDMFDNLYTYQTNLNNQIMQTVLRVNQLMHSIYELNGRISGAEASGEHANDYRDLRNNDLDELAGLLDITYKERPNGVVDVMCGGHELVVNGVVAQLGLRYTGPLSDFVEPVFTYSSSILDYDPTGQNAKALFQYTGTVNAANDNDSGKLKGLLLARGLLPANYTTGLLGAPSAPAIGAPPVPPSYPDPTALSPLLQSLFSADYLTAYSNYTAEMAIYTTQLAAYTANPETHSIPIAPTMPAVSFAAPATLAPALQAMLDPAYIADYATYQTDYAQYQLDLAAHLSDPVAYPTMPAMPTEPDFHTYSHSLDPAASAFFTSVDAYETAMPAYNASFAAYVSATAPVKAQYSKDLDLYKKHQYDMQNCLIPKMQVQLDTLVHSIVTLINDTFAPASGGAQDPNAPYGMDGSQYTEIFIRGTYAYQDRFNGTTLVGENINDYYSLYTIGNIKVNPLLLNASGYDKIATSLSGDESDATIVLNMLEKWKSGFIGVGDMDKLSVDGFYRHLVAQHSTETNEAKNYVEKQLELVQQIDGKRKMISGVSLDEEMKNMMLYQHAYNAAARVINVIDSMIDKIVNGTGRVGI